jgi:hypothetical protein
MQRSFGRDFGLSLRMGLALALVALIYLGAETVLVLIVIWGAREGDWSAVLSGLVFVPVIVVLLVAQLRKSEELLLRKVRAKLLEPADRPGLQELVARVAAQAAYLVRVWPSFIRGRRTPLLPRVAQRQRWSPSRLSFFAGSSHTNLRPSSPTSSPTWPIGTAL